MKLQKSFTDGFAFIRVSLMLLALALLTVLACPFLLLTELLRQRAVLAFLLVLLLVLSLYLLWPTKEDTLKMELNGITSTL